MQAYAMTDIGLQRNMNQDFLYSSTEPLGSLDNLFLLADGMGGHNAGDFASRFLVEQLVLFCGVEHRNKDIHGILKEGIRRVNWELYKATKRKQELHGAGTTLVAATIKDDVLYVANIGDSRLYLLREELEQVTKDHSYVEEMVALGKLRRGSKYYMQKRNVITRAVGIDAEVDMDLFAMKLRPGDMILMCSDGLSNMVDEFEMEYILRAEDGLQQKAESLVEAANRSGGSDNISVILIEPQMSEVRA